MTENKIIITPYINEEWNGYSAKYADIPVEVYHEDVVQAVKDLLDAKEEYYATLEKEKNLYCSFCEKHHDDVHKLISSKFALICNECVERCNVILSSEESK